MDELIRAAGLFKQAYTLSLSKLLAYVSACPLLCERIIPLSIVSEELREGNWTKVFANSVLEIKFPASFNDLINAPQGESVDKGSLAVLAISVAERILKQ